MTKRRSSHLIAPHITLPDIVGGGLDPLNDEVDDIIKIFSHVSKVDVDGLSRHIAEHVSSIAVRTPLARKIFTFSQVCSREKLQFVSNHPYAKNQCKQAYPVARGAPRMPRNALEVGRISKLDDGADCSEGLTLDIAGSSIRLTVPLDVVVNRILVWEQEAIGTTQYVAHDLSSL